jgi:branched-chain amino acid transport system ATP-binding protein
MTLQPPLAVRSAEAAPIGQGSPLVAVRSLVIRYGSITALHGVDLKVHAGEAVAIVGPNGAGKTSLLSAIAGIIRPADGSIAIGSEPLAGIALPDVVRRGVALVPEGRNIFGSLTVLENLRLGATVRSDGAVGSDIEEVFTSFPILGERRNQPAGQLSGGEQQMLAIARAMLSRPRLLMLDEPSLGLAPAIVDRVYELLRSIRARGVAMLVVEQNAARAFALADRACVMSHGALTLTGTPDEIARHEGFDAAYFGVAMSAERSPA